MALALSVETLDGLPEEIHSLYIEQDGKFILDLDGGVPDVKGLKSALESERAIAKAAEKAKKELESKYKDFDPEEYKALKEKEATLEEEKLRQSGREKEIEEKKQKLRDEATQKILEEKDSILKQSELKAKRMEEKALEGYISVGLIGSGIHELATEEAIDHAKRIFSLDENGNVVALDADGDPLFDEDGKSKLTISSYFKSQKLKEKKLHWYSASMNGTGSQQSSSESRAKDLSHLPPIERLTAARKMAARKSI